MSLLLTLLPATPDQLRRLHAAPDVAAVLDPDADPDRHALRGGPVVHLRTLWNVLHFLWTHGTTRPEAAFLLHGGRAIGERARAFGPAEVAAIAEVLDAVRPDDLAPRFDRAEMKAQGVWFYHLDDVRPEAGLPVARERLAEVQALLRVGAVGGMAMLVVRHRRKAEVSVDLHLVRPAAVDRYVADPALLDAHLEAPPALPPGAVAVRGWFALCVGLEELGDTPAHRFLTEGGELLDEGMQLRAFPAEAVRAIAELVATIDPASLQSALSAAVLEREGLDVEEVEDLLADWPAAREQIARWAASDLGMVSLLGRGAAA